MIFSDIDKCRLMIDKQVEQTFPECSSVIENISLIGGELKLKFLVLQDTIFPAFTGSIVRASFLHFLSEKDPLLADILHKDTEIRPYAISQINAVKTDKRRTNRNEIILRSGEYFSFSLRFLDSEFLDKTVKIFVNEPKPSFYLLNQDFPVISFEYKKPSYDISQQGFMVKIFFNTPTYFSSLRTSHPMLFPEPKYLFMTIAKNWNKFNSKYGQIPLDILKKWIEENIVINDYKIQTKRVYIGKRNPILGFKGWVVYRFLKQDNIFGWIGILCEYAKLCNVGGNRTAGMGEIGLKWIKEKKDELRREKKE